MSIESLSRRLAKVEGNFVKQEPRFKRMFLDLLNEYGYPPVAKTLGSLTWPSSGRTVPIETLLYISCDQDLLSLEDYRGLVPDEVLRKAYGRAVNWGGDEVRRRAGVIDERGQAMPGYRLMENGCIVEAANC
jgi:hypothetical protein